MVTHPGAIRAQSRLFSLIRPMLPTSVLMYWLIHSFVHLLQFVERYGDTHMAIFVCLWSLKMHLVSYVTTCWWLCTNGPHREWSTGIMWLVLRCCSSIWSHIQPNEGLGMLQPVNHQNYTTPGVKAWNAELKVVDEFCYLGIMLSSSTTVDISSRLSKANVAFERLNKRLQCNYGISIANKMTVYRAVVLTSILYGCKGWTLYCHHIRRLEQFHMYWILMCTKSVIPVE